MEGMETASPGAATAAPTPDERRQRVFGWLDARGIAYTWYEHPEAPTIEAARRYWRDDGSKHCKNLFFRNHKGNRHYLVAFDCEQNLAIHDLERRLRQGKELYHINTAVDANNLVSLETGFSLGTYDLARLSGNIVLRAGREGEAYAGIGKDELDLCRMPLLADDQGAFGCPCSDSQRAMIVENMAENTAPRQMLTVIYGFSEIGRAHV